ncbi:MAG: hypothetical protein IKR81_01470 [Victivallales bacterium]|nr:hypothetical protein [Victivallales bacterium]
MLDIFAQFQNEVKKEAAPNGAAFFVCGSWRDGGMAGAGLPAMVCPPGAFVRELG